MIDNKLRDVITDGVVKSELIPQDAIDKVVAAVDYLAGIEEVKVNTDEEQARAATFVGELKMYSKDIVARRQEITAPYKEKATRIEKAIKPVLDAIDNGIQKISTAVITYQREVERKRLAEQRRLEAEAEEKRKKEQEKAAAELAKANTYREAGREDMAQKAEIRAETHIDAAVTTIAAVVEKPKIAGTSFVETWKAEIKDKKMAIAAMINDPVLLQHVDINIAAVEKLQNAAKGALPVPGIEFTKSFQMRNRR